MILPTIIFFVAVFFLLLIFIRVGTKIIDISKTIAVLLMLLLGILIPYLTAFIISSQFERFEYKWFHFVGLFLIVGMMNNGNIKGEASKQAQLASTYLFLGAIIMSIAMFWIA